MLLLFGVPVILAAISAFLVARKVHDSLIQKGKQNYAGMSVLAFIGTFLVIGFLIFLLVFANMDFGR